MADTYEFRFRRRYGLPPNDPRFLDATVEEMMVDYWAHAHLDNPNLRKEHITDDYADLMAAMEAEMAAMGAPEALLAAREGAEAPAEAPPGVAAKQEVVALAPGDVEDDFEVVCDDRFGRVAGLS